MVPFRGTGLLLILLLLQPVGVDGLGKGAEVFGGDPAAADLHEMFTGHDELQLPAGVFVIKSQQGLAAADLDDARVSAGPIAEPLGEFIEEDIDRLLVAKDRESPPATGDYEAWTPGN